MNDTYTCTVRPRHDILAAALTKKLNDPERAITFAELALEGKTLRYALSSPACIWRVQTLFTKEPGTIAWIHSFQPGEAFVDVGANIGLYSLYAAMMAGVTVAAFEPESQNYAELNKNIFLNAAYPRVTGYCAAIADKPVEISTLLMSEFSTGGSFNDFSRSSRPEISKKGALTQGSAGFSLDYLHENGVLPRIDHLKIDVDGHEARVIAGAEKLLAADKIKTISLEVDPKLAASPDILKKMGELGWRTNPDQLRYSRFGVKSTGEIEKELAANTYAGNIVFARDPALLAYASDLVRLEEAA